MQSRVNYKPSHSNHFWKYGRIQRDIQFYVEPNIAALRIYGLELKDFHILESLNQINLKTYKKCHLQDLHFLTAKSLIFNCNYFWKRQLYLKGLVFQKCFLDLHVSYGL